MGGGGLHKSPSPPKKKNRVRASEWEKNCNEGKKNRGSLQANITLVMHMYFPVVEMTEISAGNLFLLFPVRLSSRPSVYRSINLFDS